MDNKQNQQAINDFFEGYGHSTSLEYSSFFFDLLSLLSQQSKPTETFMADAIGKLNTLNQLIYNLKAVHNSLDPAFQHKN